MSLLLLFQFCKFVFIYLTISYSNNVFIFYEFVDKYFAIPNFNLVNKPDLIRILKFEIFVHIDR